MIGRHSRGSRSGRRRAGGLGTAEFAIFASASGFKVASAMTANYYRHLTVYATVDYCFVENPTRYGPTPS